jgi:predicted NACHT family NTPase
LVLLGEPGIGKTYTIRKAERNAIDARVEQEGGQTLWLDLRSYGNEDRLVHELFESREFVLWANGTHRLHVFLDSLDECLLEINKLATLIPDEFKKYPVERLCLRIACRTADLPNVLEMELEELWGEDAVRVYELTPLRRVDVIEAANVNGLDTDAFLQEIDRMEAVPLAIKPITLKFLLNIYQRTGKLLSTQKELYLEGCRLLCEENNESRIAANCTGKFTADERMAVAARIAAATIFADRYTIWTDVDMGDVPDKDVTVRELCGGNESVNGDEIQVSDDTIRETLATGLFSSRGPKRMGWAHQTYAEFLAAQYLVQRGMTLSQMMSLITHPDGKLVPQLHETAAWLACMVPDVFQEIMRIDPEVLLRSDVATADKKDRAALAESLMRLYDEEKSFDHDWDVRRRYQKLAHPGLAEQLRPYICDSAKNDVVRRVAINIAEACELQTLQDDLVDIALDPVQPVPIREEAACAIVYIGDDTTKAKLKPLAISEVENDHRDQLKGYGLQAIWPDHITAKELFTVLTPPKVENFYGAYWAFFSSKLVQHLEPTDLLTALKWVEGQPTRDKLTHHFEHLMDDVMLKAWEHLESPDMPEAFAKAVISRFKHYDEIVGGFTEPQFRSMLGDDDKKRRRAVDAIVPVLPNRWMCLVQLVDSKTPLVIGNDLSWMIGSLQCEESKDVQRVWAELIERVFDRQDPDQFDAIFTASKKSPVLAKEFAWLIEPVELNSPRAQEMKAHHAKMQELMNKNNDRPILDPPPAERIALLLDECESGNLSVWWRLNMAMTLEPDSTFYGDELEPDLTVLPGWKAADAATKARIVETAKRYVLEQDPKTQEWYPIPPGVCRLQGIAAAVARSP